MPQTEGLGFWRGERDRSETKVTDAAVGKASDRNVHRDDSHFFSHELQPHEEDRFAVGCDQDRGFERQQSSAEASVCPDRCRNVGVLGGSVAPPGAGNQVTVPPPWRHGEGERTGQGWPVVPDTISPTTSAAGGSGDRPHCRLGEGAAQVYGYIRQPETLGIRAADRTARPSPNQRLLSISQETRGAAAGRGKPIELRPANGLVSRPPAVPMAYLAKATEMRWCPKKVEPHYQNSGNAELGNIHGVGAAYQQARSPRSVAASAQSRWPDKKVSSMKLLMQVGQAQRAGAEACWQSGMNSKPMPSMTDRAGAVPQHDLPASKNAVVPQWTNAPAGGHTAWRPNNGVDRSKPWVKCTKPRNNQVLNQGTAKWKPQFRGTADNCHTASATTWEGARQPAQPRREGTANLRDLPFGQRGHWAAQQGWLPSSGRFPTGKENRGSRQGKDRSSGSLSVGGNGGGADWKAFTGKPASVREPPVQAWQNWSQPSALRCMGKSTTAQATWCVTSAVQKDDHILLSALLFQTIGALSLRLSVC